ncbi:MAG: SHOCT domain-containing protein [Bacilli bacterium]|nr:SHOCT domain-containing protein [Bacilli bacterium]MDD4387636.1 SHOCT domain-containing protein [Bacilli bacterium]
MAFACASLLFCLIVGILYAEENALYFFCYLIMGVIGFFFILFQGLIFEVLFLGFSIITKNQHEELVEKGNNDMLDKLNNLNELKNLGIITDEQFTQKKKDILKGF